MSGQLQDEEHASRVRACIEFLDPTDQRARRFVMTLCIGNRNLKQCSYRADIVLMLNRQFRRLIVSGMEAELKMTRSNTMR
jgi:hypothetical protein